MVYKKEKKRKHLKRISYISNMTDNTPTSAPTSLPLHGYSEPLPGSDIYNNIVSFVQTQLKSLTNTEHSESAVCLLDKKYDLMHWLLRIKVKEYCEANNLDASFPEDFHDDVHIKCDTSYLVIHFQKIREASISFPFKSVIKPSPISNDDLLNGSVKSTSCSGTYPFTSTTSTSSVLSLINEEREQMLTKAQAIKSDKLVTYSTITFIRDTVLTYSPICASKPFVNW